MSQFSRNVAAELFRNENSAIHHEDDGFYSGLIGHVKPIATELFGHPDLIEDLARNAGSPLEILWFDTDNWTAKSWQTYLRTVLIYFEKKLSRGVWGHSFATSQIFSSFEHLCVGAYELGNIEKPSESIEYTKLRISVDFITRMLSIVEKLDLADVTLKSTAIDKNYKRDDIFDYLASAALSIIEAASGVTTAELSGGLSSAIIAIVGRRRYFGTGLKD
jgi:hypothetical protein